MLLLFSIRVALRPHVCERAVHSAFVYVFNCVCDSFPLDFKAGMWNLIVLVPDHCHSFYFSRLHPPSDINPCIASGHCYLIQWTRPFFILCVYIILNHCHFHRQCCAFNANCADPDQTPSGD